MIRSGAARIYLLTTLPRDLKVAAEIVASKKLATCLFLMGFLALTLPVNVLVNWAVTGNAPTVSINTDYFGLAFQRIVTYGVAPAKLLETAMIYLDYPAVWFSFKRVSFVEQARTLVMDTTVVVPTNLRYFVDIAPLSLLLTFYAVLSRHHASRMRSLQREKVAQVVSISLPSGSSAIGSAVAPMACCGGTAIQSMAYVLGFAVSGPAVILFSKLSVIAVGALLIIAIARTARKISCTVSCTTSPAPIRKKLF